ncbi:MAG: hypothetical protein JNJ61_01495, partial [Anaerolineae bacterium]|nr:hypothetical protein [Anaerolineae bacterium]
MHRIWIRLVAVFALIFGLAVSVQAAPAQQQSSAPGISEFTSSATMVDRTALASRKALIPVRWVAVNRPNNSNLVFEQLLPDGRVMNVELPRQNPIVATAGEGVVQPFPPGGDATTVTFQVRLVDLGNGTTYGLKQLTLPIGDVPPPNLSIRSFSTPATEVIRAQLNARTARVPVSWQVDNRPDGSNLVFEQVLEDGSVVNVELPRQNPIVPSSGQGVAAPIAPKNAATTSITLRLSVAMLSSGTVLATKEITLPIKDAQVQIPVISVFSTTATDVNRGQLSSKTARVPVAWQVDNRPNNSNLVFEQVLSDNSVVNVELPRSNPFVASSGVGVAAPVLPGGSATSIQLRVRLVDLGT